MSKTLPQISIKKTARSSSTPNKMVSENNSSITSPSNSTPSRGYLPSLAPKMEMDPLADDSTPKDQDKRSESDEKNMKGRNDHNKGTKDNSEKEKLPNDNPNIEEKPSLNIRRMLFLKLEVKEECDENLVKKEPTENGGD